MKVLYTDKISSGPGTSQIRAREQTSMKKVRRMGRLPLWQKHSDKPKEYKKMKPVIYFQILFIKNNDANAKIGKIKNSGRKKYTFPNKLSANLDEGGKCMGKVRET